MKKIVNKYSCVFFLLMWSFVVAQKPPAPPGECCLFLTGEELQKCLEMDDVEPDSYCAETLPIDNSKYVYISIVAGVALASFVIARKMNTKKTPM